MCQLHGSILLNARHDASVGGPISSPVPHVYAESAHCVDTVSASTFALQHAVLHVSCMSTF